MRIAAGVLLIIAAIMNIFAGAGYVLGGGLASVAGEVGDQLAKEVAKEGAVTADDAAKASEALATVKGAGMGLLVFGLFLWVLFILQIVGAVFLFISKGKMLIFIVAALSIIAEIGGVVIVAFGWTNLFGLVGGVLAFIGAMGIGKAIAAPPAAPAAPEAPAA